MARVYLIVGYKRGVGHTWNKVLCRNIKEAQSIAFEKLGYTGIELIIPESVFIRYKHYISRDRYRSEI